LLHRTIHRCNKDLILGALDSLDDVVRQPRRFLFRLGQLVQQRSLILRH
jgi:hypothetical protein